MKFTPNESVLRVALIVFSIIFGILSISLIGLGVVYIHELWWPRKYVGLDFVQLPTLLIILGCLSLLMAIAGCFCAKSYNRNLLLLYAATLLTILCLELTIAVIAFKNYNEHLDGTRTQRIIEEQIRNSDEIKQFHKIEEYYKCCNVSGCDKKDPTTGETFYYTGCVDSIDEKIQSIALQAGYFAAVLSILEILQIGYVYLIQYLMQQ